MKRQIIERDRSLQNLIGRRLFTEVYFRDMAARYDVSLPDAPEELTEDLCVSAGSLTNASRIQRTLQTVKHVDVSANPIVKYL